jgi:hypothetical protein
MASDLLMILNSGIHSRAPKPPAEEMAELSGELEPGAEVEYWAVMGRNEIMRIKDRS